MTMIVKRPLMRSRRAGISLTESAIVLGVMGLVAAAIWATASVVRARQPIQDTVQVITDIASNVRGVYSGFPNAAEPADPIGAGLFPASIINNGATINAWGGTYTLAMNNPVGTGFSIELDLPVTLGDADRLDACLGLLTRLPATATNYAGGFNDTLPTAVVNIDPIQGNAPSLSFVNDNGAWEDATGKTVQEITTDTTSCRGVAFYFKL